MGAAGPVEILKEDLKNSFLEQAKLRVMEKHRENASAEPGSTAPAASAAPAAPDPLDAAFEAQHNDDDPSDPSAASAGSSSECAAPASQKSPENPKLPFPVHGLPPRANRHPTSSAERPWGGSEPPSDVLVGAPCSVCTCLTLCLYGSSSVTACALLCLYVPCCMIPCALFLCLNALVCRCLQSVMFDFVPLCTEVPNPNAVQRSALQALGSDNGTNEPFDLANMSDHR